MRYYTGDPDSDRFGSSRASDDCEVSFQVERDSLYQLSVAQTQALQLDGGPEHLREGALRRHDSEGVVDKTVFRADHLYDVGGADHAELVVDVPTGVVDPQPVLRIVQDTANFAEHLIVMMIQHWQMYISVVLRTFLNLEVICTVHTDVVVNNNANEHN